MPWQVTGLVDGEGGFNCYISHSGNDLTNPSVKLEFKVTQKKHSEGVFIWTSKLFWMWKCSNR